MLGQTLATRPEDVYRALLEATAFGTRTIVETFEAAGVPVTEFVVAGGLIKNDLLMQIYADVLGRPLSVIGSSQGPRSGRRSMQRSRPAPIPTSMPPPTRWAASTATSTGPIAAHVSAYDALYAEYRTLHDYFGRGSNEVMQRLRAIRRAALSGGER